MRNKSLYFLVGLFLVSGISIFLSHNSNLILFKQMSNEDKIHMALKIANNNIKVYKNDPEYVIQLGKVYEYANDYDKAIETYKEVEKLEPGETGPIGTIATLQIKSGKFDDALNSLTEIININKNFSQAYTYMSLIYLLKDYTKAVNYAQLAVNTKPATDKSDYLEKYLEYVKTIESSDISNDRYNAFKTIISDGYLVDFDKLKSSLIAKTDNEFPKLPSLAAIK